MLLIPLFGPWIAMPILVTGAGTLFIGAIFAAVPGLTGFAPAINAIGNAIVLLGFA
ncbi:MAG TPA: hypothetical protein VEG44_00860 [Candidatus Acidoferrales bacterium]|nr:hypothetical protein [Candidatus Acidoferrales bacterium]